MVDYRELLAQALRWVYHDPDCERRPARGKFFPEKPCTCGLEDFLRSVAEQAGMDPKDE